MNERDRRVVESMARCGISLEGLIGSFPKFPEDEVTRIYNDFHRIITPYEEPPVLKMNC